MNRTVVKSAVLAVALLVTACGGAGSGGGGSGSAGSSGGGGGSGGGRGGSNATSASPGSAARTVSEKICDAVAPADLTAVLQEAPPGAPTDVPGGHGCLWTRSAGGAALVAVVYDAPADLPTGPDAAKNVAESVGESKGLYSGSSLTTTSGTKPVAVLILGQSSASSTTVTSIGAAALAAAG